MRILFNTYPTAFDCPGGGEVMLEKSREALLGLGAEVLRHDPWGAIPAVDVVHYFSAQGGSIPFCDHVKRRGLPLALSPVLWLTDGTRTEVPLGEVRDLLHLADVLLPNSRAEAGQLVEQFGVDAGRIAVVPNAVDAGYAEPTPAGLFAEAFGLRRPFVLNVGNVEPRKNQLRLARALAASGLDLELVVLGGVRDPDYRDACAAAGARLLGRVEPGSQMLRAAYRECALFALPSLFETPGLSALEAAASGARVVVTAEGATREYFGEDAVLVDPLDEGAIAAGLRESFESPRRGALAERARAFTWERTGSALLDAYARITA